MGGSASFWRGTTSSRASLPSGVCFEPLAPVSAQGTVRCTEPTPPTRSGRCWSWCPACPGRGSTSSARSARTSGCGCCRAAPAARTRSRWELPYLAGHTVVDTLDAEAMTEAVRPIPGPVAGILSYDEARIAATAVVAERFGLPTSPPAAVLRCRDKWLTRQALAAAGVPQATSVAVADLDEAVAAAARIGYPVVLKPRNLAASFGVSRADDEPGLLAAYERARGVSLPEAPERFEQDVLVEEFLDGPEISVDAVLRDGRVEPLVDRAQADRVRALVRGDRPHRRRRRPAAAGRRAALGAHRRARRGRLRHRHHPHRAAPDGGRPQGDRDQRPARRRHDPAARAAGHRRRPERGRGGGGLRPGAGHQPRTAARVAGIRFYYPDEDVTVGRLELDEALLPAQAYEAVLLTGPGERVLLPPRGSAWESRLAHVIAVADTADELRGGAGGRGQGDPAGAAAGAPAGREPAPPSCAAVGPLQTFRETSRAAKLVLLGVFVNQFGAFLQAFLVLYLVHEGYSESRAGWALAGYGAGAVVGMLLGGSLTDRIGPRATLVLSMFSSAALVVTVSTLPWYGVDRAGGLPGRHDDPGVPAGLGDAADRDDRARPPGDDDGDEPDRAQHRRGRRPAGRRLADHGRLEADLLRRRRHRGRLRPDRAAVPAARPADPGGRRRGRRAGCRRPAT